MAFFSSYRISWVLSWSALTAYIVMLLLAATGCVTTGAPAVSKWTCSDEADTAVAQGQWEKARLEHEALLLQDPENCLAIYHLGYILGRLEMRVEEIAYYRKALSCGYKQDDQLYFNLGMALGDMGDIEGALNAFNHAVAMNARNADNHFGKGLMARTAGLDATAERAFLEAIALLPEYVDAHLALARLYLDQSRWVDARQQLQAAQQDDPQNPEASELWKTMTARQREAYGSGKK